MNKIKSGVYVGFIVLCAIFAVTGCASTHRSTTTETSVANPSTQTTTTTTQTSQPGAVVVERDTTVTTKEPEQRGIVGGLFHVIGTIIAYPFIVVGKLLGAIF